ncbi:type 1 glutamine amidotransferase [Pseudonocardia abyssalis]|uniref:Type 1 glutamine amidotransferase n=1 Tax=Pseudonocardia abyssalis TaxID=2792008 RepID=A0ABS6UVU2_9PSEU|nr:type 1 glutamine amidotransferase [Pseudonocardia abyssalis]MBW0114877.1 type 1 glutamine amidotransferase [Pseudonocardia abyssalis]MBW0136365.1 type 1 glutamine amidotransferase [Pseudonocardia abyssalis]
MSRALVLVHTTAPGDGIRNAGTIAPALAEQGFDVTIGSLVEEGTPVPETFDLLVVMGSAESVADDALPWLPRELAFVRRTLAAGVPVLGICFGGQLLARALGGTVGRAPRPERGFVTLGTADADVLPPGTWIEFHDDAFTLPPGAVEIARNDVCVQAFTHGAHMGVQFHPEITPDVLAQWVESWGSRGREAVEAEFDLAGLVAELDGRAAASAAACRDLVARFCARLPHAVDVTAD